ncbi:MAG: hypothetical protein AAF202_00405 [Pseudomonadota bacterium]
MNKSHYVITGRVDIAPETLWSVLLDKVHHPEKYIENAREIVIDPLEEQKFFRKMRRGDLLVQEMIEVLPETRETIFELKDHENYEGLIISRVEIDKDQSPAACYLTYELNWDLKPEGKADKQIFSWLSKAYQLTVEAGLNRSLAEE